MDPVRDGRGGRLQERPEHIELGSPRDVRLELDEVMLGRGHEAQVCIESGAVSRHHAALIRFDDHYVCVDLHSSTGVT
jgi:hypothetical protein